MTDLELKRLRRVDLLELLIALSKENESLQIQLREANEKLARQETILAESGSIAEASLRLSGIFEAAQQAADQYLRGVQNSAGVPAEERVPFAAPEAPSQPVRPAAPAAPERVYSAPAPAPAATEWVPVLHSDPLEDLAAMIRRDLARPTTTGDSTPEFWSNIMKKSAQLLRLQIEMSELMHKFDRGER